MALTNQIAFGEESLDRTFGEFKTELHRLNLSDQDSLSNFLGDDPGVFESLSTGTNLLWGGLDRIRRRSEELKAPLVKIIVEIQNQDRYARASTMCFFRSGSSRASTMRPSSRPGSTNSVFSKSCPTLSRLVLEEVSQQIASNRDGFRQSLDQARLLDGPVGEGEGPIFWPTT